MRHEPRHAAGDDRRPRPPVRRRPLPNPVDTGSPIPFPKREPAAIRGAVVAAVTAVVHFLVVVGVVDKSTETALVPGIDVLGLVVAVLWIRLGVTANAKVVARVSTTQGEVVAGEAASAPTGTVLPTTSHGRIDHPIAVPAVATAQTLTGPPPGT